MPAHEELWQRILQAADQYLVGPAYEYVLGPAGITPGDVDWFTQRAPQFVLILLLFFLSTRALVWTLDRTLLSRRRVDPMLGNLVDRLISVVMMFIGFSVALLVFQINIFDLALTLGLVGAALALGLQNTVANIMGGISLVTDRPFEVGDRIQIGEYWGDVEEIGLRSTRILTARREYVIIPNRLMDEREIWNYTKRYPEIRLDIPVGISYDSDRELAKSLMIQAGREHPDVLSFPRPTTKVREFADSGLHLELWCYIGDARIRYRVQSDLLERIKDLFDQHGIEIPFPYRTLVYKSDLPAPAHAESTGSARDAGLAKRKLLVATAGTTPAMNKCQTITELAKDLDADIIVAYIVPRASIVTQREGERAASIFNAAARRAGVDVKLVIQEGEVVSTIDRLIREEGCGAVVIGAPRNQVVLAWKRANVEDRLRGRLDVPVIVVPPSLEVDPDEVEAARASLDEIAPIRDPASGPGHGEAPP